METSATSPWENVELRPTDFFSPLPLGGIFAAKQPLEIDLGCGEGSFLIAMAKQHPERNFLGVERQLSRVAKIVRRARNHRLTNVRVLRAESDFLVRQMLPPESVSRFYLLFADPWPKKRHHDRRVVQLGFLAACARALVPGGEFVIKTDHSDYFTHIRETLNQSPHFRELPWIEEPDAPRTDFERRFLERGLPINRLRAGKVDRPISSRSGLPSQ